MYLLTKQFASSNYIKTLKATHVAWMLIEKSDPQKNEVSKYLAHSDPNNTHISTIVHIKTIS